MAFRKIVIVAIMVYGVAQAAAQNKNNVETASADSRPSRDPPPGYEWNWVATPVAYAGPIQGGAFSGAFAGGAMAMAGGAAAMAGWPGVGGNYRNQRRESDMYLPQPPWSPLHPVINYGPPLPNFQNGFPFNHHAGFPFNHQPAFTFPTFAPIKPMNVEEMIEQAKKRGDNFKSTIVTTGSDGGTKVMTNINGDVETYEVGDKSSPGGVIVISSQDAKTKQPGAPSGVKPVVVVTGSNSSPGSNFKSHSVSSSSISKNINGVQTGETAINTMSNINGKMEFTSLVSKKNDENEV